MGDLLTAYQGGSNAITYDAIGNPINIYGTTLTWQGRRLTSYTSGSNVYTYTYNADGIRTSKTVNGVTHNYVIEGSNILAETYGNTTLRFVYDNTGVIGLYYNNVLYMFEKNMQGDVVAILDSNLTRVVEYAYDAWGNVLNVSGTLASTLGTANPIRYRSYYYDTETGWYYLQSRYYNPTWGRFISADNYINSNGDLIGFNMFAYCSNNPVMFVDPTGKSITLTGIIIIGGIIVSMAIGGIGAGVSTAVSGGSPGEIAVNSVIGAVTAGSIATVLAFGAAGVLSFSATSLISAGIGGVGEILSIVSEYFFNKNDEEYEFDLGRAAIQVAYATVLNYVTAGISYGLNSVFVKPDVIFGFALSIEATIAASLFDFGARQLISKVTENEPVSKNYLSSYSNSMHTRTSGAPIHDRYSQVVNYLR